MSVARRITFCEKHVRNKEGKRFRIKGREWVRDELFRAIDGYKLWPHEGSAHADVCIECKGRIGEVVEEADGIKAHGRGKTRCVGLVAEPIIVTVILARRQDGKTFNCSGYSLSVAFQDKGKSIVTIANSKDQSHVLLDENQLAAVRQSSVLSKRSEIIRTPTLRLVVPSTGSMIEALPASHRSVTGRTRTHIFVDEARDVDGRLVMALMPALIAMGGVECPTGGRNHVSLTHDEAVGAPKKCPACGERLKRWWPRLVIASAKGVLDGSERDWLYQFVEQRKLDPHPNVYIYDPPESINPKKDPKISSAFESMFSDVEILRPYVTAELGDDWQRKGEDFLLVSDMKRVESVNLVNKLGDTNQCVGFIDTSLSNDLTVLTILAEDPDSSEPWEYIYEAHLKVWTPKDMDGGVIDEKEVERYLKDHLPLYPNLKTFGIDTRGMPWAIKMAKRLAQEQASYSRLIDRWEKSSEHEQQIGWGLYEQRIKKLLIKLIVSAQRRKEIQGTMKKDGKVRDRNRDRMHSDIAAAEAICCYMIHIEQMGAGTGTLSGMARAAGQGKKVREVRDQLARLRARGGRMGKAVSQL